MSKKLAELLNERSQIQSKLADVANRIQRDAVYEEGETVSPNVSKYTEEYFNVLERNEKVINLINKINSTVKLDNGLTLSEALVRREILAKKLGYYKSMLQFTLSSRESTTAAYYRLAAANGTPVPKKLVAFDADKLQELVDGTSAEYRALDSAIQAKNWSTDVNDQ